MSDGREGRPAAIVVEPDMELYGRLAERVKGPREDLERQVDQRDIERISLFVMRKPCRGARRAQAS